MDYKLTSNLEGLEGEQKSVVVFIEKDQKGLPVEARILPERIQSGIVGLFESGDLKGGVAEISVWYANDEEITRVVLVGLGEKKNADAAVLQKAIGAAAQWVQNKKQDKFSVLIPKWMVRKFKPHGLGLLVAKAIAIGTYHFDAYKTDEDKKVPQTEGVALIGIDSGVRRQVKRGLEDGQVLAEAINHTRDLGNLPPLDMTPMYLAKEAQKLAKKFSKLKVVILSRAEMKKEKMGAMLAVSAGSKEPPAFIVMEWMNGAKTKKPLVFVGKGITFDSGGICIKPGDKMGEMKYDMLGGGAVLGAMRAIAELNVKNNVVGLIPATENLPGGSAYRPGDILRTMGGKTIEVMHTDAEGRLILADALCYASKYEPRAVMDLATLTGACAFFLGPWHAGLFSDDKDVAREIESAGKISGDEMWRLPLLSEHTKLIKSEVADVKNLGGKVSSAATAAAFLKEFVDYPWAHVDIAGTAWTWNMKPQPWMRAGATGYGVHLLVVLAQELR